MPVITDIPQIEESFRRTYVTEKIETMNTATRSYSGRLNCYTITAPDFKANFREDYSLVSSGESLSLIGKQTSMIALANSLFKGSKPLVGKEMEVLNKTFSRLRSSIPTKL
jgi:hypothetical protein